MAIFHHKSKQKWEELNFWFDLGVGMIIFGLMALLDLHFVLEWVGFPMFFMLLIKNIMFVW